MKTHSLAIAILALALSPIAGHAADLKVTTGGSLTGTFAELVPQFERVSGHKLEVFYGAVPQLIKRTAEGEAFDVAIVPTQVFKDAGAAAKFAPGPAVRIVSVGYGVAVKAGAPKPDVSTPAAFKETLLKAQSISVFPESAAGAYVTKVFDRLGIGEAAKAKSKAATTAPQLVQAVAKGEAEIGVFLINVFAAPGVDIAGPFPGELQDELVYEGALAANTKQAEAAKAFIDFLRKPEAAAMMKAKGMTPG